MAICVCVCVCFTVKREHFVFSPSTKPLFSSCTRTHILYQQGLECEVERLTQFLHVISSEKLNKSSFLKGSPSDLAASGLSGQGRGMT